MVDMDIEGNLPNDEIKNYLTVINSDNSTIKEKEKSVISLSELYVTLKKTDELVKLSYDIRPIFNKCAKSKIATLLRKILSYLSKIPNTHTVQIKLCKEIIEWSIKEKRSFLKIRAETILSNLYVEIKKYKAALALLEVLLKEVKKLNFKQLLVEILLIESKAHLALSNIPKAKGSLTSARASAHTIYCPPKLSADIELQAGTLCAEENDYKTSYSYFYESYEAYNSLEDTINATKCLKYMLLSKIMVNKSADVFSILNGKIGNKYSSPEIDAMRAVAEAHKKRSIQDFQNVKEKHGKYLLNDVLISSHIDQLYENLLEQNLVRIIEPFSDVEIKHVADLIELPIQKVVEKLSEMILDQRIRGILDQGRGILIIYEATVQNKIYPTAIEVIKELDSVVTELFKRLG